MRFGRFSRKILSTAMTGGVLLVLSGCTVGPDYLSPILDLPTQWAGASDEAEQTVKAPDLARWWERLNDPVLNALVEEAVAGNLDIASAEARIRESRALYRQARGDLLPFLSGSGSADRSDSLAKNSGGPSSQFKAGFDAGWELDLFGGNRRNVEAAGYGLEAAEEDLRSTLLTLIGDVASNYVEALSANERLILARNTAALQRQTAALTQTKFAVGAASSVDVAKALGQLASTEASIPALEAARSETLHRLSVLTGRAPAALLGRLDPGAPIPVPPMPVASGIPASVLSARPDVRMAERQLAQSTAKIGVAEAARYPSVSLSGVINTNAATFGDMANRTSIGWSIGPAVSIPLFQGNKLEAAVEAAEAQRDQSLIAYRAEVLAALEEVENALVSLSKEQQKRESLEIASRAYRQAASLAHILFEGGATSFLEVLDADRSQLSADDQLIVSRAAIATDYIALNKALGGGWNGETGQASLPDVWRVQP